VLGVIFTEFQGAMTHSQKKNVYVGWYNNWWGIIQFPYLCPLILTWWVTVNILEWSTVTLLNKILYTHI